MSRESINNKRQSNVTLITLSDDDNDVDDDEVRIIDQKEKISVVTDEDIKVVFEKDRAPSCIKKVELHTIDDTKSDLSFGTNSSIEPPVKFNHSLETHETIEAQIIQEIITIKPLDTPGKVETVIKEEKVTRLIETHQKIKPDIKDGNITKSLEARQKVKTDIKEEKITKPLEAYQKVKTDIKEEKITKTLEARHKVKPDIKEEKVTKPLEAYQKVKTDIEEEKITKAVEAHQKVNTDTKEDIDKKFKTDYDSKKNLIKLENPNISANKRKILDCNDHKDNVLQEIKPENIKVEPKLDYRSHSDFVINPNNKKFKNNTKLKEKLDMKADTSLTGENLDNPPTSMSNNTSSQSRFSKKRLKIMFTGINYEEYEKSLSTIGGQTVTNPSIADILVTDKIRRKFKFTLAIARGIPIVSIQWIKTSIDSKKFQDPFSYIIKDICFEREYNFDLRDSLIKAQKKLIFDNYTFIITRNVHPRFSDLSELIKVSGGVTLVNAPKIWKNHTFIVTCEEDLSTARRKKINSPKKSIVPIVEASFITDSIWKQSINIQDNLLSF